MESSLKNKIYSDLFRHIGRQSFKDLFLSYYKIPGFRYMFWYRIANHYNHRNRFCKFISFLKLRSLSFKFGIQIPHSTQIGKGFYIGHFSCIVVSPEAIIGKNVNISQGVTIGRISKGKRAGAPTIGDNVYLAPGCKIIGGISIGNNVAVGANAVVTKDVPDNSVVVGIPAQIISNNGSIDYINNKID